MCASQRGTGGQYALGGTNPATVEAITDPPACCHRFRLLRRARIEPRHDRPAGSVPSKLGHYRHRDDTPSHPGRGIVAPVRFDLVAVPALPRLAWGAAIHPGDPTVRVLHGTWVETRGDRFVEGAWDEPFPAWEFERSATLAGSGGWTTADGVGFAGPANMYDRLHTLWNGGTLFVSNSLAFALALANARLDPAHPHYYLDLLDLYRAGIHVKTKRLRLAAGRTVELHDCCSLAVAPDGTVTRMEKPWGPPPASYAAYVGLLREAIRATIANAGDAARQRRYRPLAMLSQGYDANAIAALARDVGCREAVTFLRSGRMRRAYVDDSGAAIADALGLAVTTYERNAADRHPEFRSEEFYHEPWGVDRSMPAMADQLVGALLLSGRSGEAVWLRRTHWARTDLQHPIDHTAGCALVELRLRLGFLHFPPATIGAALHAERIHAWNDAPALAPWSIGGDYDKPIARRILEEAGVPRHLFGHEKKGGREPVVRPRTPLERVMDRLGWPSQLRVVIRRALGNRFHPRWKLGSFEVQAGCDRMVARYEEAIAATN